MAEVTLESIANQIARLERLYEKIDWQMASYNVELRRKTPQSFKDYGKDPKFWNIDEVIMHTGYSRHHVVNVLKTKIDFYQNVSSSKVFFRKAHVMKYMKEKDNEEYQIKK